MYILFVNFKAISASFKAISCSTINGRCEVVIAKFVEKDIHATIEFIDIFQDGTHSIESGITPQQLIAIKSKAETTLKFLLEIEFSANR